MRTLPILTLLATVAFVAAPAVTPPFMGYAPDQFPVLILRPSIQPAGYAFAIWGVIYLWLIAHAAFGLWRRPDDPAWQPSRLPLLAAVGLGTVWLAIAVAAPLTATATIVVMAALAIAAFLRADPTQDRWLLSAPTGIFAGWLTAASAVSVGVVMGGYGWLSDTGSALAILGIVLVLATLVQSRRPAMPIYGATVVWALIGVVVVNWGSVALVAYAALIGAVLLTTATAVLYRRAAA